MITISEVSRFSQLSDKNLNLALNTMTAYGVDMDSLVIEIATKVESVPEVTKQETSMWYPLANDFAIEVASRYDVDSARVAGAISAVSPRMPWLRNKSVAEKIVGCYRKYDDLSAHEAAKEIGLALSNNVTMAVRILRGEAISDTLSGVKRRSFYNNIISQHPNDDSVTVDTWMMNSYCNVVGQPKSVAESFIRANRATGGFGGTGTGYIAIAESVRIVANMLDMHASSVQAIYWCCETGSINGGREDIGS